MSDYRDTDLFIDGQWRPAAAGKRIPVSNPANGCQIGTVAKAGLEDLDLTVRAAARGFEVWRRTSAFDRAVVMRRAASLLRERADTVASLMTLEQGKPLAQALIETHAACEAIEWFAGEAPRSYGLVVPAREPDVQQLTLKLPVGPVAAFTPWNFPLNQIVRKLSAALATGCSIVIKGPEESPASPAAMIEAFDDAGVPAGVISLVYGDPAEISGHLIPHPVIRKISFTGSTTVGRHLAALAGRHMKPATMELGGHAPVIVAADADLESAAAQLAGIKFFNAGQICVAPTRFLLDNAIAETFTDRFVAIAERLRLGDGMEPQVDMGPLAHERRIFQLEVLVADAVDRGARLLTGGTRIGNAGSFFAPTVLADVPQDARIMNEEPFGPIAVLNRFATLDEAITEANRLPYGLAAYAYTASSALRTRLGYELEAGMLTINHLGLALPELHFGGIKDSGYGSEGGAEALAAYQVTKLVTSKG